MLECEIQKAAAFIWPPSEEETQSYHRSMSRESGLMRWMSAMSGTDHHHHHHHHPHPSHHASTFTTPANHFYSMDSLSWNGEKSPSSSLSLSPYGLDYQPACKSSNGLGNASSSGLEEPNGPTSIYLSNGAVVAASRNSATVPSMSGPSNGLASHPALLSLSQPFKFSTPTNATTPNNIGSNGGSTRKYHCKMCPQVFHSKADMQLHTQLHMREAKPYKCSQCTKTFANSSYLSQHSRIHLGIKPYRCDLCQRKFTQLSHLQQHLRTHTGDKPYKCRFSNCTKAFSQLSNLQSHSRSHQTDKPYKCNSCYKCFTDEASLLEHIPKHKESKHLKTHICQFCGKSYSQETYLHKHMLKHSDRIEGSKRSVAPSANEAPAGGNMTPGMSENYWGGKNGMGQLDCSSEQIMPHPQQQQPSNDQVDEQQQQQQQQCLLPSRAFDQQHQQAQSHQQHAVHANSVGHGRLPMATLARNVADDLLYAATAASIDSKNASFAASGVGATNAMTLGNSRMASYFPYETISFPNKMNSGPGFDAVGHGSKKMEGTKSSSATSLGCGSHSFPNQLIALNQIRNYACMPGLAPTPTGGSNGGDHMKDG